MAGRQSRCSRKVDWHRQKHGWDSVAELQARPVAATPRALLTNGSQARRPPQDRRHRAQRAADWDSRPAPAGVPINPDGSVATLFPKRRRDRGTRRSNRAPTYSLKIPPVKS